MKKLICLCLLLGILVAKMTTSAYAEIKATAKNDDNIFTFHLYDVALGVAALAWVPFMGTSVNDLGIIEIKVHESSIEVVDGLSTNIPDGTVKAYDISGNERNFEPNIAYDPSWERKPVIRGFDDILEDHPDPVAELTFKNNKLNGISRMSYGINSYEMPFDNNEVNGIFKAYNKGIIFKEANVTNGVLNGKCKTYGDNGLVATEANYENGKVNGDLMEYSYQDNSNNLTKKVITQYKNDLIDGYETEYYYKAGTNKVASKRITTYKKGTPIMLLVYNPNNIITKKTTFDSNGDPKYTYIYNKNGKIVKTINNEKERAKEKKEIAKAIAEDDKNIEKIKSKLSEIKQYYTYEDVVSLLGEPRKDNLQQVIKIYGNGYATWLFSGWPSHSAQITFENRYCTVILLDDKPFRVFKTY